MTIIKVFEKRDRAIIWTVKVTLLVAALARFSGIVLYSASRRLNQMIW
jgi:hypothetical protein